MGVGNLEGGPWGSCADPARVELGCADPLRAGGLWGSGVDPCRVGGSVVPVVCDPPWVGGGSVSSGADTPRSVGFRCVTHPGGMMFLGAPPGCQTVPSVP